MKQHYYTCVGCGADAVSSTTSPRKARYCTRECANAHLNAPGRVREAVMALPPTLPRGAISKLARELGVSRQLVWRHHRKALQGKAS